MKNFIKKNLPEKYYTVLRDCKIALTDGYARKSYSTEGEDILLNSIFRDKKSGFYVDVGANHPKRASNTYLFYKKGWKGINIDANPGSMKLFNKIRPDDINIECAISDKKETLTYFIFNDSSLNTFSSEIALSIDGKEHYRIIQEKQIETCPLSEVLDKYLPDGSEIDFLSVDVEGFDLNVIKSNNWDKYRPEIVLVEIHYINFNELANYEICKYLTSNGYNIISKLINTVVFKDVKNN
ncbi:MAG TPA: FkbM family methyltransferase [Candidatus Eremiobacteraeota bacterium]|nr:FkbM family methyltransferase [Candidatus Eremiobacteraeota bacterium]